LAGSLGFWAVFILCNGEREDEGRQGDAHAACHGAGTATTTDRRRTAAAPTVCRHCDNSKPARRRTAEAPLGAAAPPMTQGFLSSNGHASSTVAWRRLKAFSQHGSWGQRPSRRKLALSSCRLRHHPRCLVLLQTGPRHQARGPLALAPRTSRRTTALLHAPCSSIRAPVLLLRQGGRPGSTAASGRRAGSRWQTATAGASPIQCQRICLMLPKHMTALRQGVALRAPEVMLDDAVQAHPGRLHLRRL